MSTTELKELRKGVKKYIDHADERVVKMVYAMLETNAETDAVGAELADYDWTKDKELLAELDARTADYKSGKVKGIGWKEAKEQILASQKNHQ